MTSFTGSLYGDEYIVVYISSQVCRPKCVGLFTTTNRIVRHTISVSCPHPIIMFFYYGNKIYISFYMSILIWILSGHDIYRHIREYATFSLSRYLFLYVVCHQPSSIYPLDYELICVTCFRDMVSCGWCVSSMFMEIRLIIIK